MTTYTYPQQPAQQQRTGGTDVTAWALVAVVVAMVCAGAGWAIASNATPSRSDVSRTSELAAREAAARGQYAGYRSGAAAGRRETALQTKLAVAQGRASAQQDGFNAGFGDGRVRAQNRSYGLAGGYTGLGGGLGTGLGTSGAYPSSGYEDILSSGLFGADAPGYSDSSFSSLGYGSSASTGYPPSGMTGNSPGDSYGY